MLRSDRYVLIGLAGCSALLYRRWHRCWSAAFCRNNHTCDLVSRRYLQNITIPAAFVQRSVGDSLKKLIKPQKDLPHPKVLVSLDWTDLLPRNEVVRDRCASTMQYLLTSLLRI